MYVAVYEDAVADISTGYIRLYNTAGTLIPGLTKAFTKHAVPALNLNVYHAEFERTDGYSTPPKGVGVIRLLDHTYSYTASYLLCQCRLAGATSALASSRRRDWWWT